MENGDFDRLDNAISEYGRLTDALLYASYKYNRNTFPDRPASNYAPIFSNWKELEGRYLMEQEDNQQ